ncbi:MAG TPA: ABC transporter ATP-binding protein [Tepidisphaeraceae bacterium]|nr:ABC transporter ATP-binding protein [Tepidisphaeraceae bacterium]
MSTEDVTIPDDETKPPRSERRKDRSNRDFWRACQFLYPYRWMVATSILCALFVGVAFTGGLSSLAPMMQVFLKGDTVATWANREIVERRLGVTIDEEELQKVVVVRTRPGGFAEKTGVIFENSNLLPPPDLEEAQSTAREVLRYLSDPATTTGYVAVTKVTPGTTNVAPISLPPVPRHLAMGRQIASRMPAHPVKAIAIVLAGIACLAIVSNVVKFFQEYLSDKAAILAVQDIRKRLYDHVLHVPMSHFNLRGASDVTSRLTQDAQELAQGFKTVLGQSIQEPIKAGLAFGLAVWVSWKLTFFIVVFAPLMFLIIKKLGKKMRRASRKAMVNSASMLGQIEGSLIGIRVVKGASAERFERRRYSRIMSRLVEEQLRMSRIDAFSAPTIETLTFFVVGAIVLFASYMVLIRQSLNPTSFILVMACLGGIGDSLRRLSKVNNVLQKGNAAASRIFEVMDLPVERTRERVAAAPKARLKLPPIQREVRFEKITFSYPNASGPALVDLDLVVPKGQSVAIVGRNGSGKTTLLALLPRFYDPQKGRVLVDGIDVRDVTLRSLRDQISIVTQDSVIFPGTIAENIAYGHPLAGLLGTDAPGAKALMADVEAAAKRAFAHDFILDKPQGYNTMLGELGGQLSGGQKQRVCIARAILRKAPILILDEATSQVDAESEHLIQQAIEGLMHERTTFVIAHRFSTILSADTIVVMDRGRIVGQGRHEELLRTCETYLQLYERQLIAAPA